jgi:hypothetical protein
MGNCNKIGRVLSSDPILEPTLEHLLNGVASCLKMCPQKQQQSTTKSKVFSCGMATLLFVVDSRDTRGQVVVAVGSNDNLFCIEKE